MKLKTREVAIFGMLGALMYASKVFMELLPNVHLLGVFTISFTLVYRKKALYPIYTYILLNGLFAGFATWWIPYLYLWTILWGVTMLLPQKIPKKIQPIVYMIVNACHGFLFGTLYAPAQAILFGLSFKGMIACRIAVGFCARCQQFLLWNIDCSDCDTAAEVRETSGMRSV